ncbi:MAG: hypothetical protein ACJ8C4_08215 [Gemmataceae bacterium]
MPRAGPQASPLCEGPHNARHFELDPDTAPGAGALGRLPTSQQLLQLRTTVPELPGCFMPAMPVLPILPVVPSTDLLDLWPLAVPVPLVPAGRTVPILQSRPGLPVMRSSGPDLPVMQCGPGVPTKLQPGPDLPRVQPSTMLVRPLQFLPAVQRDARIRLDEVALEAQPV